MCFLKVIASTKWFGQAKSSLKPIDSLSERHASDRSSLGELAKPMTVSFNKLILEFFKSLMENSVD